MPGWSNFCTLVGHFSKLFEFAGLSRLKIPIFVPKSGCSLKKKKKVFTWNRSAKFLFLFQNQVFSKKKKVFTWNRSAKFLFSFQNQWFSKNKKKKKKKGLHLESVSKIPILAQNHSVLQKKITAAASDRQDLCKIDMRHAAREPVVGPRCYRRLPLLMIDKT